MTSDFEELLRAAERPTEAPGGESPAPTPSGEPTPEPRWWDRFVPASFVGDAERIRRARLQVRFGILGAVFGALYAAFYFVIGHGYGGGIILLCSVAIGLLPWCLRRYGSLTLTGHLFAIILLLGFSALCLVEGGMRGHAIAWLASIPLCVLLLVTRTRAAVVWTAVCSLVAAAFGLAHIAGIEVPKTYPAKWGPAIDAAGYAGLVPFMAILGLIFEMTRRRAFDQLRATMAELSMANEHLVRLNTDKNEFLGIAAHDLKNPLGIISGYAGLLRMRAETISPGEIVQQSDQIVDSAERMLDIISNLLDVRAIEDGSLKPREEPCEMEALIGRVMEDFARAAESKEIAVSVTGEVSGLTARSDCGVTRQILDNLVSNAIKYSPPGRRVTLALRRDERDMVAIDVIDEGPGLSESDQAKLFQKFTRLTPKPTAGESSNGLGLWIVHRMAQAMGGEVSCESALGRGSVFRLKLPLYTPA